MTVTTAIVSNNCHGSTRAANGTGEEQLSTRVTYRKIIGKAVTDDHYNYSCRRQLYAPALVVYSGKTTLIIELSTTAA